MDQAGGIESGLNLHCADTQGCSSTEDSREDGCGINDAAQPALGATLANQRNEGCGQQLLTAQAEGAVGNSKCHDGVEGPGVKSPVEQGGCHGVTDVSGFSAGNAIAVVGQGLGDAVKHQADAHACGEHHGHPRHGAEFWSFRVLAKANVAEAAERDEQDEEDEHGAG